MSDRPVKLGLIGAGRIGRLHAEHLANRIPGADLVMVTDVNEAAARECAQAYGIAESGPDYRRILERRDIEGILVCSSTDTHTPIIEDAAAAGKHIFCEKPIDADLSRIDRAVAAVRKAGVILQVGFNRRFDANFQRIRQAIVSGEIGTPHQVHIISRDPAPPPIEYVRRSGGLFLDMTIHDFDMAQFLIGDTIREVYATGGVRVNPAIGEAGDLDTAVVLLKFANGVMGVIENCRQAVYGYDQRVEVFGSGGSIRVDNNYPNTAILSVKESVRRDLPLNFFLERYVESYLVELRAFLASIRNGSPSLVSGEEGRVPVVVAQAAMKSWKENRPVLLTEIG
ncbi:MAG: inositol 2-dehydrogenase [Verrucomicrobiales bacterium]|nr:inositol 2-dehydrogenase [Verrucomicrobiales bacterium]